jgi:hypothetical protein
MPKTDLPQQRDCEEDAGERRKVDQCEQHPPVNAGWVNSRGGTSALPPFVWTRRSHAANSTSSASPAVIDV